MKREREESSSNRTKSALVSVIIRECENAIHKYCLEDLLKKAKEKGFEKLDESEVELFTLGGMLTI